MSNIVEVSLFQQVDEGRCRVLAHVVTLTDGACFVIQIIDRRTGIPVSEEICPPMRHAPDPFVHVEDILDLEERTEQLLRSGPAAELGRDEWSDQDRALAPRRQPDMPWRKRRYEA